MAGLGRVPVALIPNETAVRALGFAAPAGRARPGRLNLGGHDARIVGVFKDFNWSSAHTERQNMFFGRYRRGGHVSLRVSARPTSPARSPPSKRVYARLFPGNVFRYGFADETFEAQYREDQRFATLFTLFAGLAIAIACLGLFGLAAFTAQQRTKEVGVRKVLGACGRWPRRPSLAGLPQARRRGGRDRLAGGVRADGAVAGGVRLPRRDRAGAVRCSWARSPCSSR